MVCNQKIPQVINLMVCVLIPSEIYLGLEKTVQNIQENTRSVSQVCVFLFNRATDTSITRRSCPVEFSFMVGVIFSSATAGIVKVISVLSAYVSIPVIAFSRRSCRLCNEWIQNFDI